MSYVQAQGAKLFVQDTGSGCPIVFVHELEFVTVHNKKVQNFLVSPLGLYSTFDQAWLQK